MGDHSHHDHHGMMGHNMLPATTAMPMIVSESESMDHDHHSMHGNLHGAHDIMNGTGQNSGMNHHNMMMHMFFHLGNKETILFEFWKVSDVGMLILSMIIIFLLAFCYEALKFYREHLYRHSFQTVQLNTLAVPVENGGTIQETHKTVQVSMLSWIHIWQTILHVVQVVLSYFLMLIFMTYNVWLCLAVAFGAGAGYFFFGWKKSLVVDITEHCH